VSIPTAPGSLTGERAAAVRDPLHDENVRLVGRVQRLRAALETAQRENGDLRRNLAQAYADNRHLRSLRTSSSRVPAGTDLLHRTEWIRIMLADSHSRNP
jgi:hypothetical protein